MLRNIALLCLIALAIGGAWFWMDDPKPAKIGGEAVTFFDSHGNWETMCDQIANRPQTARCYVRLVDVYSHRPDFGAYVGFITGRDKSAQFEISLEPGSILTEEGFFLASASQTIWQLDLSVCSGNVCKLDSAMLGTMVSAVDEADRFEIHFADSTGKRWQRELSVSDFLAAYSSYIRQVAKL